MAITLEDFLGMLESTDRGFNNLSIRTTTPAKEFFQAVVKQSGLTQGDFFVEMMKAIVTQMVGTVDGPPEVMLRGLLGSMQQDRGNAESRIRDVIRESRMPVIGAKKVEAGAEAEETDQ